MSDSGSPIVPDNEFRLKVSAAEIRRIISVSDLRLADEVRAMREDINRLKQSIATLSENVANLPIAMDDLDHNKRARIENAGVTRGEMHIALLKNTSTHEEVPLPATMAALSALTAQSAADYLRALGEPVPHRDELVALKRFIGVPV
ncbi:hypothetical protein EV127DRAFT_490111 [Xylaria flabelliformis]|nr:hypothetical protein EV127DRAFT_490111 [Xylaria flabelliformis]